MSGRRGARRQASAYPDAMTYHLPLTQPQTIETKPATAFGVQWRIIYALVLRDMRTRYGRTFFGYLFIIVLPLSHLVVLMSARLIVKRFMPVGPDYTLFIAAGVLPYILCLYPARMMMFCLHVNQPLLLFPIVKPIDVIFARAILETIVAFAVVAVFLVSLYAIDVRIEPLDAVQATEAVLSAIFFGISYGFFSAVIYKMTRAWIAFLLVSIAFMFATSGAYFVPSELPPELRNIIWFNPLMHSVEWLRYAYCEGYGEGLLSREYLLGFSSVLFLAGLVMERAFRGKLMIPS
jgi:capsular polysaccharide transport system permease protein